MAIPEAQLKTWSSQGATVSAKATHESIRRALAVPSSPVKGKDFEIYLQGSYKNDTNIRGNSDVDVVVQLNESFSRDLSALSSEEVSLYNNTFTDAWYKWHDFNEDVRTALTDCFGKQSVVEGNKSLTVVAGNGRLKADVITCIQYRRYRRFRSLSDQDYVEGMMFYTRNDNRPVVNFPKVHYENGVDKNRSRTQGWYKWLVRTVKNARSRLIDNEVLEEGVAPSYFVECLLYNAPDEVFGGTFQESYFNLLKWMQASRPEEMLCQNEQLPLFGDAPEQWSVENFKAFRSALIEQWNGW